MDPPKGYGGDGLPLAQSAVASAVLPARRLTAYSIFANQERNFVLKLQSKELQKHMGRYFSMRWKTMEPEERELYEMLARTGGTKTGGAKTK